MLNAGQDEKTSVYQTYFVFAPLFSKPILTRQERDKYKVTLIKEVF